MSTRRSTETAAPVPPGGETPAARKHTRFGPGGLDPALGAETRFGHGRDPATRLIHGQRSERWRVALVEHYAAALAAKRAGLEADRGGTEVVSTVLADAITRYLETDLMLSTLAGELQASGVFTARGRVRSAFGAYMSLLDRWHRLATLIGVERRAKPTPSLQQFLETFHARTQGQVDANGPCAHKDSDEGGAA